MKPDHTLAAPSVDEVIEPIALRIGWAPQRERLVIQIMTDTGTIAFALRDEVAHDLAANIIEIMIKVSGSPEEPVH